MRSRSFYESDYEFEVVVDSFRQACGSFRLADGTAFTLGAPGGGDNPAIQLGDHTQGNPEGLNRRLRFAFFAAVT